MQVVKVIQTAGGEANTNISEAGEARRRYYNKCEGGRDGEKEER